MLYAQASIPPYLKNGIKITLSATNNNIHNISDIIDIIFTIETMLFEHCLGLSRENVHNVFLTKPYIRYIIRN